MKRLFWAFGAVCLAAVALLSVLPATYSKPEIEPKPLQSLESSSMNGVDASIVEAAAEHTASPYYVLLIGNDSRFGSNDGRDMTEEGDSYSDTIMLMQIDPVKHRIAICSIPRDTAVSIDGEEAKINDYHLRYGPEGLSEAVSKLFDVPISFYFDTTFANFAAFIDALGGVTVDVPVDMYVKDIVNGGKVYLYAGEQHLSGAEALALSRMRKDYPYMGEACRQQNARQIVSKAIVSVAADDPENAGWYAQLLESACRTNMPQDALEAEVRNFMEYDGEIEFNMGTGPYEGDIDWTDMWRTPYQPEVYAQLSEAMREGTPLTDIVPNPM